MFCRVKGTIDMAADEIKKKLDWDPDDRPFAKVAAQNCSHMILQVTLLKHSSNTP